MRPRRILLIGLGAMAAAAVLAPVCGARILGDGIRASTMPSQSLTIVIRPTAAAGHQEHVSLPTFAIEPGLPVRLTVVNQTRQPHTFTVPGLGVSALIAPAHGTTPTRTVVTFTAHAFGAFDWKCLLCPVGGSAGREVMHGKIYAIVQV
jgi:hypothetical protein